VMVGVSVGIDVLVGVKVNVEVGVSVAKKVKLGPPDPNNHTMINIRPTTTKAIAMIQTSMGPVFWRFLYWLMTFWGDFDLFIFYPCTSGVEMFCLKCKKDCT